MTVKDETCHFIMFDEIDKIKSGMKLCLQYIYVPH